MAIQCIVMIFVTFGHNDMDLCVKMLSCIADILRVFSTHVCAVDKSKTLVLTNFWVKIFSYCFISGRKESRGDAFTLTLVLRGWPALHVCGPKERHAVIIRCIVVAFSLALRDCKFSFVWIIMRRSRAIRGTEQLALSLIHIWRCRRSYACRSRWSPYH